VDASEQFRILASGAEMIVPEDELRSKLATGKPLRAKLGIDPSAPDIHIGHAVVLRKLRRFQELGHTAVLIIGDFTGMVGDPTGRSEMRRMLTIDEVRANGATYVDQVGKILLPERLEVRWNSEWLGKLGPDGLLRLAGQATVARMLERDDFAKRYKGGQPISVVEFLYPLLQGYDSVAIEADVELGATEQLFNLLVGRDLQRNAGQPPQVALAMPILEGLDGVQKMGKSLGNYVGITDEPEEMFGKLMSVPDALVGKYLRLTTDLHPDEVEALEASVAKGGAAAGAVKRRLAREVITLYHDAAAATGAEARFDRIHKEGGLPDDIPVSDIPAAAVSDGRVSLAGLITALELRKSTSDARRAIAQGGVSLDDEVVTDETASFEVAKLAGRVLKVGKRQFVKLR
jgi:tyrosyl-tRNA synthetase